MPSLLFADDPLLCLAIQADIDTPLLVTQASEDSAAKLTPEERKKKAQELIKAAKVGGG